MISHELIQGFREADIVLEGLYRRHSGECGKRGLVELVDLGDVWVAPDDKGQ